MTSEKKYDLLTGEEFVPARISQKFATRANAIKYNNLKAKQQKESLRFIHDPLKKNLRFLTDKLSNVTERIFTVEYLNGAGYDLTKITHYHRRHEGELPHPCLYNFMMIKINDTQIKFVRYD